MRLRWIWLFLALLFPVAAHAALPCSAYPNTLTNGTLADANQVMANFNSILNCVNALAPIGTPTVGVTSNVRESLTTAGTSTTVTADSVTVGTALNGTSYTLTSYSQVFAGATVGAGGMDTGSLPTSGFVGLYAIYNPTAPSISILGTNCASACPTVYGGANMPAGYTASALLTVLPTNATPAIATNIARGKSVDFAAKNVLNTTTNQATPVSLSITTAVPPVAVSVKGYIQLNPSSNAAGIFSVTVGGDNNGATADGQQVCAMYMGATAPAASGCPFAPTYMQTAQTIFYNTTNIAASMAAIINISGYTLQ